MHGKDPFPKKLEKGDKFHNFRLRSEENKFHIARVQGNLIWNDNNLDEVSIKL